MPDPLILATWTTGQAANAAGWPHLIDPAGGALDAVEHACRHAEADPQNMTVGYGGRPDAAGEVTLDASIMVSPARRGAVCFVRRFMHPVSVARLVMDRSPHVLLAGDGAERFARAHGLESQNLLTDAARQAWQTWLATRGPGAGAMAQANIEEAGPAAAAARTARIAAVADARSAPAAEAANASEVGESDHDTIGVLARDAAGRLAGACSSSGLAFKTPGRVGDSPIIGHGLYVDPQRGAAVATGHGELVMGVCGTFLAVERMGQGASPAEAAAEVVRRIAAAYDLAENDQVGIITLAPDGTWSSAAIRRGFRVAVRTPDRDELVEPSTVLLA